MKLDPVLRRLHEEAQPTEVILVDGVGVGAFYLRTQNTDKIVVGNAKRQACFERSREAAHLGREVYRLAGYSPAPGFRSISGYTPERIVTAKHRRVTEATDPPISEDFSDEDMA